MAALATVATLAAAGVSAVGTIRQSNAQKQAQRMQADAAQSQEQARQQELIAQREKDRIERGQTLERTIASTRARLGAAGVAPDEGSASAITTGLRETAAASEGVSDDVFRVRLARGRASLLAPDGSLGTAAQLTRTLGQAARSLLG
jgi:hypothetical protein